MFIGVFVEKQSMDENEKWFISIEGEISGPLSMVQVRSLISKKDSRNEVYLWSRGQKHWLSPQQWQKLSDEYSQKQKQEQEKIWFVLPAPDKEKSPPLNQSQLLGFLKTIEDLSETRLWTEGMREWKNLYVFHKIIDDLGVARRRHPRAELQGQVVLKDPKQQNITYTAQTETVSEGGMGLLSSGDLKIGKIYQLTYNGPDIFIPIRAKAEIIHMQENDKKQFHCGLRFTQIDEKYVAAIIEYVMKKNHESSLSLAS